MIRATLAALVPLNLAIAAAAFAQETAPVAMEVETTNAFDGTVSTPIDAERAAARTEAGKAIATLTLAAGFSGEIMIDMGGLLLINAVSPDLAAKGFGELNGDMVRWPYASVTKQILAARITEELDANGFTLDTPISEFVPQIDGTAPVPTVRQLLQHRAGLRNPDETPVGENTWPAFYSAPGEYGLEWCLKGRSVPPGEGWSYNNCDYIVLGAAFDELSFETADVMLTTGYFGAKANGPDATPVMLSADTIGAYYAMAEPESATIPAYGASAAMGGTLMDLAVFNWNLMKGYKSDIEGGGARAEFWQGKPALNSMALGQWVFDATPETCDAPVTVAQRKGQIGRYRIESVMLPALGRSMIFATTDPDFEFGEIWMRSGALYDAVETLACGDRS